MTGRIADQHSGTNVSHKTTALDDAAIVRWLRQRWPERGSVDIHGLSLAQGGGSSSIIVVEHGWDGSPAQRSVVRLHPGDDPVFPLPGRFRSSPAMEWAAQQAFARHCRAAALPPLLALEEDVSFLGRPFMVMGFVEGVVCSPFEYMRSGVLAAVEAGERKLLFTGLLEQLALLHNVPVTGPELADFAVGAGQRDTLLVQLDNFECEIRVKLAGRSFPVLEEAIGWLRRHAPDDDRIGLCWGDARPGNAILAPDLRPLAVIDWEGASIIPSESDIGWWSFYDETVRAQGGVMAGIPSLDHQLGWYVEASGRTIENLGYWKLLAAMKTALVLLRVRDRLEQHGLATPQHLASRYDNFATGYLRAHL